MFENLKSQEEVPLRKTAHFSWLSVFEAALSLHSQLNHSLTIQGRYPLDQDPCQRTSWTLVVCSMSSTFRSIPRYTRALHYCFLTFYSRSLSKTRIPLWNTLRRQQKWTITYGTLLERLKHSSSSNISNRQTVAGMSEGLPQVSNSQASWQLLIAHNWHAPSLHRRSFAKSASRWVLFILCRNNPYITVLSHFH